MSQLVSLIVPVFNGEKYLSSFIESFKRQTYANLELIFIDDGSSDNSFLLMKKYADENDKIRVIHQQNKGPSEARNNGMSVANGEYICFADVDDYFFPTYVEYLYTLIKSENADIAFCNYKKVVDISNDTNNIGDDDERIIYTREEAIEDFCYRKHLTGYSYLKLISKSCLAGIRFPNDIVYGEDFIFSYKLLNRANKIVYGNRIQYFYWQNLDSATHISRDNTQKYQDAWKAHMLFLDDVSNEHPDSYRGAVGKCYLLAINNMTRVFDKKRDFEFTNELLEFIKKHALMVFGDQKANKSSRVLGALGFISPRMTCVMCDFLFAFMEKHKLTFRRTV